MDARPYKCEVCHASFRGESGKIWHIAHHHEGPRVAEALGKTYEEKMAGLRNDNAVQAQQILQFRTALDSIGNTLLKATAKFANLEADNAELMLQVRKLSADQTRLCYALVGRDRILEERFGLKLPSPFGESDDKPSAPKLT